MIKAICFDLDGVIANFTDGWQGFDVIATPNKEVINTMWELQATGWFIVIWTCRADTPTLRKWLKDNKVPYDSLNSHGHNPPCTSHKPIYHVMVDDRAINYHGQDTLELLKEIAKFSTQF